MEVSDVKWVEKKVLIDEGVGVFPYTFFRLDPSEQLEYNSFRVKHDRLKELRGEERKPLEERVNQIFANLITPYLDEHGMKIDTCFRMYGNKKETLVTCYKHNIFDEDESFDLSYEIIHWFSTDNEDLSCRSKLTPHHSSYSKNGVLENLVSMCIENYEADGKTLARVYLNGKDIQFASIEFAIPVIGRIGSILKKVGKDRINELKVLRDEYLEHFCPGEEETIQGKVFKELYDQHLNKSLVDSGLMKYKLELVK